MLRETIAAVRADGRNRTCRCPAHDDRTASLSVSRGDNQPIVLKCFAGCAWQTVLDAAGMDAADIMREREHTDSKPRIVKTYEYEDEQDNVLYEAVRYEPKNFRQRRPDGRGGWTWNMKGMRRVVYALSTIRLRLRDQGAIEYRRQQNLPDDVFIVEGEKDADRLLCRGLTATTNVGGAGKWREEYTQQLVEAGAKAVVILPDNDEAGRQHAEQVSQSCHAAGLRVKVVALPDLAPKGDVSDWLSARPKDGLEQLIAIVKNAPVYGAPEASETASTVEDVDFACVLNDVEAFIRKYVVLSNEQSALTALWVAQTHALAAFDYVAYLHIKSPMPECGKTRLLETLEALTAKPWMTGRVTAAVLMRKVDAEAPTLLLDESDAAFNGDPEYAEGLRGMLNSGFHRSGRASACVGQGANLSYKDFSTFGAKAIAGIGRLPSTVESRSIPIALKRRTKDETVAKWRRREAWAAAEALRAQMAAAGHASIEKLRQVRPSLPDGLSDRAEDVLEPLFAIAVLAGDGWAKRARTAAVNLMGYRARVAQETDQNVGLELLVDIKNIIKANKDAETIPTADIIKGLTALDDRPWSTLIKGDKPITGHRLSKLLRGFDVHPGGTIREGDRVFRGYRADAFAEAFSRYLPDEALQRNNPNENGPEVEKSKALHEPAVTDSKSAVSPDKHCLCNDVTLRTPEHEDTEDTWSL